MKKPVLIGILAMCILFVLGYTLYQIYIVIPYVDKEHIPHDTVLAWIMWSTMGILALLIFGTSVLLLLLFVFTFSRDSDAEISLTHEEIKQPKKEKKLSAVQPKKEKTTTKKKEKTKSPKTEQKKKVKIPAEWKQREYE